MHEIILPEAKPALEWINNRIVQKVTPQRSHALAQRRFAAHLGDWADQNGAGVVGTEWQFQVEPPGEDSRTLVPDIAFLSYDRMSKAEMAETEIPRIAPDVLVEIRSPKDAQADIGEKTRVYLAAGTIVVFLVDPALKTTTVVDADGSRLLAETETIRHSALLGFELLARTLFELP